MNAPLPNFFLLGAAKSGTSSLYAHLAQHPDVYASEVKETRFFDYHYHEGLEYYRTRHFAGWSGGRAIGEATPHYLYLPFVARRIREAVPDARLIAIIRNPVDRALSHWWMEKRLNHERLPFRTAIERGLDEIAAGVTVREPDRWNEFFTTYNEEGRLRRWAPYIEQGHYADQIRSYREVFSAAQLHVIFLEDFVRDAQRVVREAWEFLRVDPDRPVVELGAVNASWSRAEKRLRGWLERIGLRQAAERALPTSVKDAGKRWMMRWSGKPRMGARLRRRLIDHYRPHNRALERITRRDLSSWNS